MNSIIEIYEKYQNNRNSPIILFYNCDKQLIEMLKVSKLVMEYIIEDNNFILIKYDVNELPSVDVLYTCVIEYQKYITNNTIVVDGMENNSKVNALTVKYDMINDIMYYDIIYDNNKLYTHIYLSDFMDGYTNKSIFMTFNSINVEWPPNEILYINDLFKKDMMYHIVIKLFNDFQKNDIHQMENNLKKIFII